MFTAKAAFCGFSVDKIDTAKEFYEQTLGLKLHDEEMGLQFELPGGGQLFVYDKSDHQPATYTVLNFVVEDINKAVDELKAAGVEFEIYPFVFFDGETRVAGDQKHLRRQIKLGLCYFYFANRLRLFGLVLNNKFDH